MPACSEPLRLVPGPQGPAGSNGSNGSNGLDSFTQLTSAFTLPAIGLSVSAAVSSSGWITVGQALYVQFLGVLYVTALPDSTHVTLQNNAAETGNAAPGTVAPIGSKVSPAGFKGAAGSAGGAGTGVTVATKGDIQSYAGAPANLPVGTNGQLLRALSTAGTGLDWEQIVPNATGVGDDNKIAIANCPVGTETPANIQFTLAKVTDTGAYQTVGGNARGVDAVDQQAARAANAQVASGNNSTIAGGRNNTASAQGSTVVGGEGCVASGADSIAGGSAATASGQAAVAFGRSNIASAPDSGALSGHDNTVNIDDGVCAGGALNLVSGLYGAIVGGNSNTASGQNSFIASAIASTASGYKSAVISGSHNLASGDDSFIGSGQNNTASKQYSCITGGGGVVADKYGQSARNSGFFLGAGDCQASELMWRVTTTDATANVEAYLDGPGASQRATVPNNTTWAFVILVSARASTGVSACWEIKGGIRNNAGATALVAAVSVSVIADGTGATWGLAGNVTVDADDPNDTLRIRVTGAAATTIRWSISARIIETGY